jgi:hypothetical protein
LHSAGEPCGGTRSRPRSPHSQPAARLRQIELSQPGFPK